jgi:hypothetical protein
MEIKGQTYMETLNLALLMQSMSVEGYFDVDFIQTLDGNWVADFIGHEKYQNLNVSIEVLPSEDDEKPEFTYLIVGHATIYTRPQDVVTMALIDLDILSNTPKSARKMAGYSLEDFDETTSPDIANKVIFVNMKKFEEDLNYIMLQQSEDDVPENNAYD